MRLCTYIVLLEKTEVADHPHPHQECRRSQQNPTQVIRRDVLIGREGKKKRAIRVGYGNHQT